MKVEDAGVFSNKIMESSFSEKDYEFFKNILDFCKIGKKDLNQSLLFVLDKGLELKANEKDLDKINKMSALLLSHGANPNIKSKKKVMVEEEFDGNPPFWINQYKTAPNLVGQIAHKPLVEMFLEYGGDFKMSYANVDSAETELFKQNQTELLKIINDNQKPKKKIMGIFNIK